MKKKNKIILLISLFLIVISVITILLFGNRYNYVYKARYIDHVSYDIEGNNVKVIKQRVKGNDYILTLSSIKKGKTYIVISDGDLSSMESFYVHSSGIITKESFFGDCNLGILIPISFIIIIIMILYSVIDEYKTGMKENMYQYKNILYLGLAIFLSVSVIINILFLFNNYNGLLGLVDRIASSFNNFALLLLPIAFLTSICVIVFTFILIRKEGLNIRNFLGIVLGLFFCLCTVTPEILYRLFYNSSVIDIHNQNGLGVYFFDFVETSISLIVTYLESVFLSTAIIGIKAAKRIPSFDKDFIIILGCQIREDGSLTNLLKSRVDRAIEFREMQLMNTNKDLIFIPSGGKGNDEIISEGDAIHNYLISRGIKEKNIIVENKSKNTHENMTFSNKIIKSKKKTANICYSTNNYHVFRAGVIASNLGIKVEGIGAKTKTYFWINAFIREFIAELYIERKRHILINILVLISIILIQVIFYFGNVL